MGQIALGRPDPASPSVELGQTVEDLTGVLTDGRLRPLRGGGRRAVEAEADAGLPSGSDLGVVDGHDHAVVDHLGVVERLVCSPHRSHRDPVGPEFLQQSLTG